MNNNHWPRVTDNSSITTYGLMALGREMSTPPKLQWSMAQFTLLPRPRLMALGREMSTPPKLQQKYGTLYLTATPTRHCYQQPVANSKSVHGE